MNHMRVLCAGTVAVAAVLSLAACGGGMNSRPALSPGDIRELTGLSAPAETAQAQQARQQEILARSDSLILSTWHVGVELPDETRAFRELAECSGTECALLEPVSGRTDTISLGDVASAIGDGETIGTAHGVTLMWEGAHSMGVDITSLGAWMAHGAFMLNGQRWAGEEPEINARYALAVGELTGRPLAGSATWLGIMAGTPVAGEDEGDRLVGTAALSYDMGSGGLDAAFGGITNIDRGTAHGVEAVHFSDLAVEPDGTFARGQSGARIQGGFYGPDHAEAGGIFELSGIIGGFGARRQ